MFFLEILIDFSINMKIKSIETQLNPTVMQHIVTSLRIQNTSITAESEMSGFMCRLMIKNILSVTSHVSLPPTPVTDRHTFLDPLPLERDMTYFLDGPLYSC